MSHTETSRAKFYHTIGTLSSRKSEKSPTRAGSAGLPNNIHVVKQIIYQVKSHTERIRMHNLTTREFDGILWPMRTSTKTDWWYILSPGNTKTGDAASFDLPPVSSCPGASEFCKRICYSLALCRTRPVVAAKYERNMQFVWDPTFVTYMVRHIPKRCTFRIHVSGDFFHPDYVKKWIEIATRRKDVQFYCYTRSWREHDIWRQILKLGRLSNVTVNVSCDSETGRPKDSCKPFRWCYLSSDDTAPRWLRRTDLIFRTNHSARIGNHQWKRKRAIEQGDDPDIVAPLIHRMNDKTPVCPLERGKKLLDFRCSDCTICMKDPK